MKRIALVCVLLAALVLSACSAGDGSMQDGYYTAEAADFDANGWKEYITIYVTGGTIVTVEYDAKNASGFIKSWDMEYMRAMSATDGTYPNKYVRAFSEDLLNRQDPTDVDAVAGATHSYQTFRLLAEAAMDRAEQGDTNVAFVDIPEYADE